MRVEVDKVLELSVDDPFHGAVAVFELDAEDGVPVVEGVEGVGDLELCGGARGVGENSTREGRGRSAPSLARESPNTH